MYYETSFNLLINKIYLLKNLLESFESVRYTLLSLNNIELIKITNISCFFFCLIIAVFSFKRFVR